MADLLESPSEIDPLLPRPWRELAYAVVPVVALVVVGLVTEEERRPGAFGATVLLVVAPLLFRRVLPYAGLIVVAVGALVSAAGSPAPGIEVCSVALASFTLGERAADRTRSGATVIVIAIVMAVGFLAQEADVVEGLVVVFLVLVPTWLLGDIVRSRREEAGRRA